MFLPILVATNCFLIPSAVDQHFVDRANSLIGSCEADEITINEGVRYVNARAGKDVIIDKSTKLSYVQGGSGNDIFYSGPGTDVYYGGTGYDLFVFDGSFGHDQIEDLQISQGDRLIFVSYVEGTLNADLIKNSLSSVVEGGIEIDFTNLLGFEGSKLLLKNMSVDQFKKLNIEVRLGQ